MRRARPPRKPTFLWQGLLILLPVLVLAGAGFLSLRQDRILVHREAAETAQALADDMALALWTQLTDSATLTEFRDHAFCIDGAGRLLFPPPSALLPAPPSFDSASLNPDQQRLGLAAQAISRDTASRAAAVAACRDFLALDPPEAFRAAAHFRLGVLLADDGQRAPAAEAFRRVAETYPEAVGESGVPLGPLAQFKVLALGSHSGAAVNASSTESLCSNLVHRPTFLTSCLLDEVAKLQPALGLTNVVERWQDLWDQHEGLRVLAASARRQLASAPDKIGGLAPANPLTNPSVVIPPLFWFQAPDLTTNPQPVTPPAIMINSPPTNTWHAILWTAPATTPPPSAPRPRRPTDRDTFPRTWLGTRLGDGHDGYWIVCRAKTRLGSRYTDRALEAAPWVKVRDSLPRLPRWFGFSLDLAGETVVSSNALSLVAYGGAGKGSGQTWREVPSAMPPELLASARHIENGVELLRVNIHLVSPELLFAMQRARGVWFGLLILAAALVAVVGYGSARRAFLRQQSLSEMKTNFRAPDLNGKRIR